MPYTRIYSKAMNAISLINNDLRSKELAHDLVDAELRMLWVAPARRQEKVFWLPSLYRAGCVRERRNTSWWQMLSYLVDIYVCVCAHFICLLVAIESCMATATADA
jgi:hypothetical protein